MRVKREHPELRPCLRPRRTDARSAVQDSLLRSVPRDEHRPVQTLDTSPPTHERRSCADAGRAVTLHRFPRRGIDVDLHGPVRPPVLLLLAALGPASQRRLPALDAATDHVGAVNGVVVLDRGFLECERTRGALAVLPCDLLQSLGIAVVDDRREVERCRRFVEEASTASAGSPRGTGKSVPVRWEGFRGRGCADDPVMNAVLVEEGCSRWIRCSESGRDSVTSRFSVWSK